MSVLVSGSIAIDNVKRRKPRRKTCSAVPLLCRDRRELLFPVGMVGVVGHDFPAEHLELFKARNINLDGVEFSKGETFRWSGEYMEDMNDRETLSVALNVLESWQPAVWPSRRGRRRR